MNLKHLLLAAALGPALAQAEITPPRGTYDPRVRIVDYNPLNVVKLATFYGVSTHIEFAEGEQIRDTAVGDDLAWKVVPRGNHLFTKPQATKADTNVTVITNLRTYQFALVVQPRLQQDSKAWKDHNLIFSLKFRYPQDEAALAARQAGSSALQTHAGDVKGKLTSARQAGQNYDYWVAGSEEIAPTAARDDGRFIYLTFSNNRDMPAVYAVDSAGNESLINTNVADGNTIVVQRLVPRVVLRKGVSVASVLNKSFHLNAGADNASGTIAPDVERVLLKGR